MGRLCNDGSPAALLCFCGLSIGDAVQLYQVDVDMGQGKLYVKAGEGKKDR